MDRFRFARLFSFPHARHLAGAALIGLLCGTAAPAVLAQTPAPPAAATAVDQGQMSVRLGAHQGYTRLVFDFPKLTAYRVEPAGAQTRIVFDTPLSPSVMPQPSALLKGIGAQRLDSNTLAVTLTLAPKSEIKHYRLMRRVVVDIHADTPPAPVKTAEAKKPAPPPVEKTTAPAPVTAKPVAPATTAAAPEKENTAAETAKALGLPEDSALRIDTVPAPAAAPVEIVETVAAPTTVTLSTVEPTKLAVFERNGMLWIVMAGKAGSSAAPLVSGPDQAFMGEAAPLNFDGGRAYRYLLPPDRKLAVTRKSLQWTIALGEKIRAEPAAATLEVGGSASVPALTADLKDGGPVLKIEDPVVGDMLLVVPVSSPAARIEDSRRYANVEILPSGAGMALRPLADDVTVEATPEGLRIASGTGIAATRIEAGEASAAMIDAAKAFAATNAPTERLFDFPNWLQGGIRKLNDNRRAIEQQAAAATTPEARLDALQKLALLYFANGFGEETLGILRLVMSEDPEFEKNPNIIALRGAAAAMAGHYEDALQDLSTPAIQTHPEVKMWTGYAAAATEQWRRADGAFPRTTALLSEYPSNLAIPMTIYMAESNLRLGHADTAAQLLGTLKDMSLKDMPQAQAAIDYLRGEAARQDGRFAEAIELWKPVAEGLDRLYHTKASLALTLLQLQEKQIGMKEAIDRIDSLRFAWRGDGLEVQTLAALGRIKILNGQYVEGLDDLKTAAGFADQMRDDSTPLRDEMAATVRRLFVAADRKPLKPLQAVSVYNTYGDLLPEGEESRQGALNFADYLVQMDLLDRAAAMISESLDGTADDAQRADIGTRLAAIYLLDGKPALALDALLRSNAAGTAIDGDLAQRRTLLRARAQSQLNQTDDAIATLAPLQSAEAKRLTADVLWRARRFTDAAAAIEALLPQPLPARLDDETARLVMNMAVGYKLAGDSTGLADVRQRFAAPMAATPFGPTFTVVTRDGGSASLGDRDTILKIAGEVDMFKSLLDSYKATTQAATPAPAAPAGSDGG